MKRREIDKALRGMKIQIKRGTLQGWAKCGVISAYSGSRKYAEWPEWTLAEVDAASHLIRSRGWLRQRVALIRSSFWRHLEKNESVQRGLDSWLGKKNKDIYRRSFEWLIAVLKARVGLPVDQPATVTEVANLENGTVRYVGGKPAKAPKGTHPGEVDCLRSE